jgi:hypothetical protein
MAFLAAENSIRWRHVTIAVGIPSRDRRLRGFHQIPCLRLPIHQFTSIALLTPLSGMSDWAKLRNCSSWLEARKLKNEHRYVKAPYSAGLDAQKDTLVLGRGAHYEVKCPRTVTVITEICKARATNSTKRNLKWIPQLPHKSIQAKAHSRKRHVTSSRHARRVTLLRKLVLGEAAVQFRHRL